MQAQWMRFGLLAAVLMLATGAVSTKGVEQADQWQREADMARNFQQWPIGYQRYSALADVFPGTRHGRIGAVRARQMQDWGLSPDRSSASDDPVSWAVELFDFVTWP